MNPLEPAELLEKGAAYIEEHGLWQGAFCSGLNLDHDERWWEVAQREGRSVCAMGSLIIASAGTTYHHATVALGAHVGNTVPFWNDTPGRTAAEVADAMRACAAGLRGES